MSWVRNSILALSAVLIAGAVAAYFIDRASYGYAPRWKSGPEGILPMLKGPPLGQNEYRLWVVDASHVAYFSLSKGNLVIRLFQGQAYGASAEWQASTRISATQFDRFLRNIYRTGVYDKKPGSRVKDDGTYAIYVATPEGYVAWGSNDWTSAIRAIVASFFALCPDRCAAVRTAMPGVELR